MSNGSLVCPPEIRAEMGARLRRLRKGSCMTITMVGAALGLQRQAIAAYERGETAPSAEALRRLTRYYRTTADYILFGGAAR